MPIREILRAIVFLNRNVDGKDFNEIVNCIPDERMQDLEAGLKVRRDNGKINTVQIGRYRMQAANFTSYTDDVDKFFEKIDGLHSLKNRTVSPEDTNDSLNPSGASRFTGFDDIDKV